MLSKEPVRIRRDWDSAVIAECDFCSHSGWTVAHSDSGKKICASCCDIEFLSNWQDYAKSLATEVLSLHEQLTELKALPPFAWGLADKDGNAYLSECCIGDEGCMIDEAEGYNYELEPEHHIHAVPLFTAAKPAED
ncbi:hypothetical protein [Yersinia intermedia]|uniref:hypothetical protein n=1 Tax=Yersinia intermedia TaxID=631 RepID=UPI001CFDFB3F|nr:hypothetical protein [Yersinia intermedia]MCB5313592.1 hypothetical protein [Yersinia intermedia]